MKILNTSFFERVNLTIRQSVSKLTRRTWGPAHYAQELVEHLDWWLAYYHFIRYHESLKVKLATPSQRKRKTAACSISKTDSGNGGGLDSLTLDGKGVIDLSFAVIEMLRTGESGIYKSDPRPVWQPGGHTNYKTRQEDPFYSYPLRIKVVPKIIYPNWQLISSL